MANTECVSAHLTRPGCDATLLATGFVNGGRVEDVTICFDGKDITALVSAETIEAAEEAIREEWVSPSRDPDDERDARRDMEAA